MKTFLLGFFSYYLLMLLTGFIWTISLDYNTKSFQTIEFIRYDVLSGYYFVNPFTNRCGTPENAELFGCDKFQKLINVKLYNPPEKKGEWYE